MLFALALATIAAPRTEPVLPRSIARACVRRGLPRGPCTDLRPIFEQRRNYPREALARRQQGVSHYRVQVGVNGRVATCEITRTSGSRSLDEATCRILRDNVAYDPARDPQGQAVSGEDHGYVTWRLPGR
jgi:protein TonB